MPELKSTKPARRFAIEPVETTTISRRSAKKTPPAGNVPSKDDKPAVRRFLPQPVETTTKHSSNRSKLQVSRDSDSDEEEKHILPTSRNKIANQKQFAPQLIETAKRSRKIGDQTSAVQQQDKTDNSPGDRTYQPRRVRMPALLHSDFLAVDKVPWNAGDAEVTEPPESRFSFASLSVKPENRRRSFRVPTLESITSAGDSDGSDDGGFISPPSTTPSAISEEPERHEQLAKLRRIHTESHDESDGKVPSYFLDLANTAARQQLREQALAAFPNERDYQSVSHFAIEEEDDVEDRRRSAAYLREDPDFYQRRLSATAWDLQEMQRHKEMREEERQRQRVRQETPAKKKSEFDPWHNPYDLSAVQVLSTRKNAQSNADYSAEDAGEHSKMRNAASPPMLGGDLLFPKTQSPQHTMMDPTQRPKTRKYEKHDCARSRQNSGLWTPHSHSSVPSRKPSDSHQHASASPPSTGLWGGCCQNTGHLTTTEPLLFTTKKSQTGVNTPFKERANPLSPAPSPEHSPTITPCHNLPITPPLVPDTSNHLEGIETMLQLEATLDEEYPDSFVTQVYNYLSLGYPALARDYDEELSKISRVPIEDIRRGDDSSDSRGHIGAPETEGWDEKRVMEQCGRWSALRLYIREWARQQPKFRDEGLLGKNARGRRGSWGV